MLPMLSDGVYELTIKYFLYLRNILEIFYLYKLIQLECIGEKKSMHTLGFRIKVVSVVI